MFLHLSKKISMPDGLNVKSLAWNLEQGWLACGGDLGLLKVLKLDSGAGLVTKAGVLLTAIAIPANLSMNQTLEGHHGAVLAVSWNPNFRKLTSSDDKGLIIVWVLHKGMWFEEMINNRHQSVVRDLRWSGDGQNICILYEDGQVVMGNVDGNRLWGKELGVESCLLEWSPDARLIIFCTPLGECHVYDCTGNLVTRVTICFPSGEENCPIVGIDWYNGLEGQTNRDAPTLAIALLKGHVQLMKHELDEEPILLGTRMMITSIKWNPLGEVLAVLGLEKSEAGTTAPSVQLYSNLGIHIRTLPLPGTTPSALAWEGTGLRLALAVDSFIYLANVRPEYKWAFFGGSTCVYSFKKKGLEDYSVMFWDILTGERYLKYVKQLVSICGAGEYCALATRSEETQTYILILCNAIGNPLKSKHMNVEPLCLAMTSNHIFVASEHTIFWWRYGAQQSVLGSAVSGVECGSSQEGKFHIDEALRSLNAKAFQQNNGEHSSEDQICCMCASENLLLVGRESGIVHRYMLPSMTLEDRDILQCRPQVIQMNCNCTRLAVIDMNGVLTFYSMQNGPRRMEQSDVGNRIPSFERKDVWNMIWADDNAELLAVMEKSRMYILRGTEPEEPVSCTAYLCGFHELQIYAVQLDEVMREPEQPGKVHVFNYETKSLRDTHQILSTVDIGDAYAYVKEHSHPKLWITLAEFALEKLNLSIAEKAFVKCQNYYGIQFVKGLHVLKDKKMQLAEISVYFKRFDDAERLYIEMDRSDLAIDLRIKLGDWFIVERLIEGGGGNDSLLELTWNSLGNFYADRQNWAKAAKYYSQAKNNEKLIDCFYSMENWDGLERVLATIHDGSSLLLSLAQKFLSVGLCDQAVSAFCRAGNIKAGIDCCVELNHWDKAVELSRQHNCEEAVDATLTVYTTFLLQSGNRLHAVEVFQKGGKHAHAGAVLKHLADLSAAAKASPLEVKKLYVLAALEMDKHQLSYSRVVPTQSASTKSSSAFPGLTGLMHDGGASVMDQMFDNPWHGAEAYHLWLIAHQELYAGHFDQAMKVAWWLTDYEDVIQLEDLYSLLALTSFYNKHFFHCSKAFQKLESLRSISVSRQQEFAGLALSIFTQYPPGSPATSQRGNCPDCGGRVKEFQRICSVSTCGTAFPLCMASGVPILEEDRVQCYQCKHLMIAFRIRTKRHCPLCHALLKTNSPNESWEVRV